MIEVVFPDGAARAYEPGTTGFQIATAISPSLAKRTVAMAVDGIVTDLHDALTHNARVEFLRREDPRALQLIRHDAAHVLAEAVSGAAPGYAGHDRPGNRRRILLRFLSQGALHS